ncbi:MAG TPA: hypothetical protein VFU13_04060 [Steroidobacteraceae bacterium]|nr:hypothetical protein [Steroidobacteraceae bacterium]
MHGKYMLLMLLGAALAGSGCGSGGDAKYVVLNEQGTTLRDDFNRARGAVRLIIIIDPTCSGCLRGVDDMNEVLLSRTADPRLQTFVVHVPVMQPPPEAKDIAPATKLLKNPHVRHYWNPSGAFGDVVTEAAGLERNGKPVFAWDVWLIYGPDAVWQGKLPPKPQRLMHQLWALQGSKEFPHLDPDAFAMEVRQLLAQLPSTTQH